MPRDLKILTAQKKFLSRENRKRKDEYAIDYELVITYSLFSYCIESEYNSVIDAMADITSFQRAICEQIHWRKSGFFEVFPVNCQSYSVEKHPDDGRSIIRTKKEDDPEYISEALYLGYIVVDQSNACYPLVLYDFNRTDRHEQQHEPKYIRAYSFLERLGEIIDKLHELDELYKSIREKTNIEHRKNNGLLRPDCFFNAWVDKDFATQVLVKEILK